MIALAGCAGNPAPSGWLPRAEDAQRSAFGAWVVARDTADGDRRRTAGELIAVAQDTLYVLSGDSLRAVPRSTLTRVRVATYGSRTGTVAGWAVVGSIATISHGWYSIITLPIWIIGGTVAASAESRAPLITYEPAGRPPESEQRWHALRSLARFPSGLPPGLDGSTLRPKGAGRRLR